MINILVAYSKNKAIGMNNQLLCKLSNDLKNFKKLTSGNTVIMGRKTFESIGKSLPNRKNIVVTKNSEYNAEGCIVSTSIEDAISISEDSEIFIIGGGEIYKQSIHLAGRIYLTLIHHVFEADTYFPELGSEWIKVNREDHQSDEENQYNYSFITYEKCQF